MIAALERISWASAVSGEHGLMGANGRLRELAQDLPEEDLAGRDALELVAAICSMYLRPGDWEQPYGPMMSIGDQRTMVPDDCGEDELFVLQWLAKEAVDTELRARSADIAWLLHRPRAAGFNLARIAVEAWAEREVEEDEWFGAGEATWRRALEIAKRLKMSDLLTTVQGKLLAAAGTTDVNPVFIGKVISVIQDFGLGENRIEDVAGYLADAAEAANDGHVRRQLLLELSRWIYKRDAPASSWEVVERVADSWVQDAESRQTGEGASFMIAASFLENALQELRRIPRKYRSTSATVLLDSLPRRIREAGEASLEEMHEWASDPIDLTDLVKGTQDRVAGKDALNALAVLADLSPFASIAADRKQTEDLLQNSLAGLIGSATYAGDGRKIHSSAGANDVRADGIAANVWQRMMTHYSFRIRLIVTGQVRPALEILTNEHRLRRVDFDAIVQGSALIPPHDAYLYALGLFHGFNGDFAAALHLLAPRIESMVRFHLREAGVDTSRIGLGSAEMETGLSTLMESPEATGVFGEDIAYEIRALLCGPLGPNLRNRIAHGLVSAGESEGEHGEYLWWFALKLVFIPFYNRLREQADDEDPEGATLDADATGPIDQEDE